MNLMSKSSKKINIAPWEKIIFYSVAIMTDFLGILLLALGVGVIMNTLLAVAAGFFFWFTLTLKGVNMVSPKSLKRFWTNFIGEAIPFLNGFPWWTLAVYLTLKGIKRDNTTEDQQTPNDSLVSNNNSSPNQESRTVGSEIG